LAPGIGTWVIELSAFDGVLTSTSRLELSVERHIGSQVVIEAGSIWRYLDNDLEQPDEWKESAFNDSTWKSGNAQLGYGDGDEQTVISFGDNAAEKINTYYFRNAFSIEQPSSVQNILLELVRDDGAVVYLNGQEVIRHNLPEGEITHQTFALTAVGGDDENTFFESPIDPALLVSGNNVLAVEIHQANPSSVVRLTDCILK
jgi:hypothetical protein